MTTDAAHSIYIQSKFSTPFVNSKARVTRVRLPFLTEESSEEKSQTHILDTDAGTLPRKENDSVVLLPIFLVFVQNVT